MRKRSISESPRVVIAESFSDSGITLLKGNGVRADVCVGVSREELLSRLHGANGLIVRSETKVDRELLSEARDLTVIARAGVGVDAIDVEAATAAGIVVVNTPGANTIAATEQTFALMLAAMRKLPFAHAAVHAGEWERKSFIGRELYGKTLGIIGLGRIGSAVAMRAAAFGMIPIANDPYIPAGRALAMGVELVDFESLLKRSDIVSLHVPATPQTRNMIDAAALMSMKDDALLVNCARGSIIDAEALLAALDAGKLFSAAVDVVPNEPPLPQSVSAGLLAHPRVVATPHLGGSTVEALERIALDLASDVVNVLAGRPARGAVNSPHHTSGNVERAGAFTELAFRMGRLLPQLFAHAAGSEISIVLHGELVELDSEPFVAAVLAGVLPLVTDRRVSIVNAVNVAEELGLRVTVQSQNAEIPKESAVVLAAGNHRLVGTVTPFGARIIEIDGFEVDAAPIGTMLVTRHRDVPGMVGRIGTILGEADVNISTMQVARTQRGGAAIMVLDVDRNPGAGVLARIAKTPGVDTIHVAEV